MVAENDGAGSAAVERLIDVLVDGDRLPTAEITALQRSGHDIRVERADDRVVAVVGRRPDDRLRRLTRRERDVAARLAVGDSNRQAARALGITLATVKDHVHAILSKTGFQSRSELIAAWYGGLPSTNEAVTGRCSNGERP